MSNLILFVSVSGAVLSFFLVLFLSTYIRKRTGIDIFHRMRRHNVPDVKLGSVPKKTFLESVHDIIKKIAKPLENKKIFLKLELKLRQAGISTAGAEFFIIVLLVMFAAGFLVYALTISHLMAAMVGLFIPLGIWFLLLFRFRKRRSAFTEQLGDCLVTVANALRAGYSFQQAMEVIAKEMESPISQEFSRASTDIRMGVSLESVLEQMDRRIGSADFSLVVTAVLIQREVGGNLAQILDTISDTIMERIRMKREINALTAQGRISAIVLLCLPFAMGLFLSVFSPEQMEILFEEPTGQMAVVAAIVMDLIGYVLIRRIVDIDI